MKRRDNRGRFVSKKRWEKLIVWSVVLGIMLPIIGHAWYTEGSKPVIYERTTENVLEVKPEPREVRLLVVPTNLNHIADCESGLRKADGTAIAGSTTHFKENGEVKLGEFTDPRFGQDVGKYQINTLYHEDTAESMGIDIWSEWGNTQYAVHLYNTQGTQPWSASKSCWQHSIK